jgi:hypothetical protein
MSLTRGGRSELVGVDRRADRYTLLPSVDRPIADWDDEFDKRPQDVHLGR